LEVSFFVSKVAEGVLGIGALYGICRAYVLGHWSLGKAFCLCEGWGFGNTKGGGKKLIGVGFGFLLIFASSVTTLSRVTCILASVREKSGVILLSLDSAGLTLLGLDGLDGVIDWVTDWVIGWVDGDCWLKMGNSRGASIWGLAIMVTISVMLILLQKNISKTKSNYK